MGSSSYWSNKQQEIKRLTNEKMKLQKEIEFLRHRDILKAEVSKQKKEKFYRTPIGQTYSKLGSAYRALEKEATSPKTKQAVSKLEKDIGKLAKKLLS